MEDPDNKGFMIWYSTNKANSEDMQIIVDSFNLGDFSGPELLTVVKQTGLFSVEEIDKKCIEKFKLLEMMLCVTSADQVQEV